VPFYDLSDRDLRSTPGIPQRDRDVTARRELHRIAEQVPEHLLQPARVARNHAAPRIQNAFQADALGMRRGL